MARNRTLQWTLAADAAPLQRALASAERKVGQFARSNEAADHKVTASSRRTSTAVRRRAEETVAANALMTKSFHGMARSAVTAGLGFASAYIGFGKAREAVQSTEELAHSTLRLHNATGLSIESASKWNAAASVRGIQSKQLAQVFGILSKNVDAANQGSQKQIDLFKRLGVSQAELHRKDLTGIVASMADGFQHLGPGIDKTSVAMQTMGRGWQSLMPLMNNGSKGLREQLDLADKYHVTLHGKTVKSLEELIQAQREMKFASLGVKVAFTEGIAPALIKGEQAAAKFLRVISDPNMSSGQKWHAIEGQVGHLVHTLDHFIIDEMPKIADEVAKQAPHVAGAFVKGFLNAGPMGQLVLGGWLLKKFGGIGAAAGLGKKIGGSLLGGITGSGGAGGIAGAVTARGASPANPVWVAMEGGPRGPGGGRPGGGPTPTGRPSAWGTAARVAGGATVVGTLVMSPLLINELLGGKSYLDPRIPRRPGESSVTAASRATSRGSEVGGHGSSHFSPTRTDIKNTGEYARSLRDASKATVQLEKDVRKLRSGSTKSLDDLKDIFSRAMNDIAVEMKDNPRKGRHDMTQAIKGAISTTKELFHDGKISVHEAMQETASIMKEASRHGRTAFTNNIGGAIGSLKRYMSSGKQATAEGMAIIEQMFAKEMALYGIKGNQANADAHARAFDLAHGTTFNHPHGGNAVGGWIGTPGSVGKDTVPTWLAPGEAVLNRHQQGPVEAAMQMVYGMGLDDLFGQINRPHYMATGGRVFGVQKAKGSGGKGSSSINAMLAAASGIDSHHYGYSWGGGHNSSFSGPYDCSGAVSAVLHAGGVLNAPMVAEQFMNWGAPGPGKVTTYASPGHVYMSILGRFFGTSGANPGGGAGFFPGGPRSGFVERHIDGAVSGDMIRKLKITGPQGALRSIMQGEVDKTRGGANKHLMNLLASQGQTGGGDWGQAGGSVRDWLTQALRITGHYSPANLNALLGRAMQESGGNPNAINRWDSNAAAGHPSQGLLQTIPSTFAAYRDPKVPGGILNPIANAVAAIRYMFARYGHIVGPSGSGYARGGRVGRKRFASGGFVGRGSGYSGRGPRRYWDPFTKKYEEMSAKRRHAIQAKWYRLHPTQQMPTGPKRTRHFNPYTGRYQQMGPDQWKSVTTRWHKEHPTSPIPTQPRHAESVLGREDQGIVQGFTADYPDLDMDAALAALTPGTADDIGVLTTRVARDTANLRAAKKRGNRAEITALATALLGDREALKTLTTTLTDTGATLKELKDEIHAQTKVYKATGMVERNEALAMMADLISGRVGALVDQRGATAGAGTSWRF